MKTRKGKLFTLLLILTVVFTFTGIAYGTSESVKDAEDQIVQTEESPDETVQDESSEGALEDEMASDDNESTVPDQAVEDESGEESKEETEEVAPVPTVLINGMVSFNVEGSDQAQILYGGDVVTRAIEVDPQGVSAANPFAFSIVPAQGYEVESVSLTSVFNDRAKPSVPAAPLDSEEAVETEKSLMGGGLPYEDLSDELKAALDDTSDKTVDVIEPGNRASVDSDDASLLYSIEDMTLFAGRDVTVTVKMKEIEFDAWFKVVDALAMGQNVKLTQNLVAGEDPQIEGVTAEEIERNKKPAVVKTGSSVVLDLNGYAIESKINGSDALIQAHGANTALTITDPHSTPIYGGNGTLSASADEAGRLATWDSATRTLTYYLTDTLASGESSVETCLVETVKAPDNAGMISGGSASLVAGTNGSTINIEGGIFSVNNKAINVSNGTLVMTGGYIVNCNITGDNGAGINAANSAVTIAGNAVVANNTVSGTQPTKYGGGDGGGVAVFATNGSTITATIGGNAIIAGNVASGSTGDVYNHPFNGIGGGIYTRTTNGSNVVLNIGENAVIAGNKATYNGGGIYQEQGTLNLGGNAYITNNVTEKGQEVIEGNGSAYPVHYGGGGIFSLDRVKINGNTKITANKAGGSGGGLLMSPQGNQVNAVFQMEHGYFAGNLAITNEGGAMCLTTKGADKRNGSYIYSGYITNNKTATEFDYGGGGVFVTSNGGELYVYNPLVTNNEAMGSGGGAAACQNGIVVSSDAAIFDNIAHGKALPKDHPIGGQWPSELGFTETENTVDGKYAASDFYGARESLIYNGMLSTGNEVGTYNWKGFMSGNSSAGRISAELSKNWNSNNWFTLYRGAGDNRKLIANLYLPAHFNNAWINGDKTRMSVNVPVDSFNDQQITPEELYALLSAVDLAFYENGASTPVHYALTVDSPQDQGMVWKSENGRDYWSYQCSLTDPVELGQYEDGGALYNADGTVNTSGWEKFKDIYTETSLSSGTYEIFKINQFPENETVDGMVKTSYADAKRMMGLTACPSDVDKAKAKAAARLVISGNYSAANGGGLAVNGKIVIGRDPKSDTPDKPTPDPEPKFGSLNISKMFDTAIDQSQAGKATVLFKVSGYLSKNHYHADKANPYYSDVFEINFDVNEGGQISTNSVTLKNLPVNAFFVIEEISDSGFNTSFVSAGSAIEGASNIESLGDRAVGVEILSDKDGAILNAVMFHNTYDPDKPWNDGIQNNWHKNMAVVNEQNDQGEQSNGSDTPNEE